MWDYTPVKRTEKSHQKINEFLDSIKGNVIKQKRRQKLMGKEVQLE